MKTSKICALTATLTLSVVAPLCQGQGMEPRASAADYQAQAKAGTVTIGAEFTGHTLPTPQGSLATEEWIAVEVGLFGPPEAKLKLSLDDFALRVNEKKTPQPGQSYVLVVKSVKDPEWAPPDAEGGKSKSKTSMGAGGGGGQESSGPPPPPKVPIELQRAWAQRVQKAALLEGERTLPQAGLIFFQYRGKASGIRSLELVYNGPAGPATIALQP